MKYPSQVSRSRPGAPIHLRRIRCGPPAVFGVENVRRTAEMKPSLVTFRRSLLPVCIAVAAMCCLSACALYEFAQPAVSLDGGKSMAFDPVALAYATFIILAIVILSWVPIFLFLPRKPSVWVAVLTSVLTYLSLGAIFWLVEGVIGQSLSSEGFYARATRILGDGNDLVFLPLISPLLSAFSGFAYTSALWLSNRMGGWHRSR